MAGAPETWVNIKIRTHVSIAALAPKQQILDVERDGDVSTSSRKGSASRPGMASPSRLNSSK